MAAAVCTYCNQKTGKTRWDGWHGGVAFILCRACFVHYPDVIRGRAAST